MIAADGNSILMKAKAKFGVTTLLAVWAFSPLTAAEADLPYYGAKLKDLDAIIEKAPRQALIIKVGEPVGYQANISVLIQQFPGTMKDYKDVSRESFDQLFEKRWKFLSEKQNGEKEWSCEFVGTRNGQEYQFYTRAVKEEAKVYLITSTALQEQWASVGEKMRRQVNAFKAD